MNEIRHWSDAPPFAAHLGVTVRDCADGHATVSIDLDDKLTNRKGDAHGGVLMTLLDMGMSMAIRSMLSDYRGLSTISMSVNFIAPGQGNLIAHGHVTRIGRSMAFGGGEILDAAGNTVATSQATFRIIR